MYFSTSIRVLVVFLCLGARWHGSRSADATSKSFGVVEFLKKPDAGCLTRVAPDEWVKFELDVRYDNGEPLQASYKAVEMQFKRHLMPAAVFAAMVGACSRDHLRVRIPPPADFNAGVGPVPGAFFLIVNTFH